MASTPPQPASAAAAPKPKISFPANIGAKTQFGSEPHETSPATVVASLSSSPQIPKASTPPAAHTKVSKAQQASTKRKTPSSTVTEMAEPAAKRAKRTDSSALWDKSDTGPKNHDRGTREPERRAPERERNGRDAGRRDDGRDGRRRSSRSRERTDRRRDRSRSREKVRDRDGHGQRDRDRSRSRDKDRERNGSRRGQSDFYAGKPLTDRSPDYTSTRPDRHRDRSRSPVRNGTNVRTRSPPNGPKGDRGRSDRHTESAKDLKPRVEQKPSDKQRDGPEDVMELDKKGKVDDEDDDEDALIRKMMGFSTFKSTQNTKVPGNNVFGVRKEKKTEYRQYMNRVGGFNRPLSPSR